MSGTGADGTVDREAGADPRRRFSIPELPERPDLPVVGSLSWPDRLRLVGGSALLVLALAALATSLVPGRVAAAVRSLDVDGTLATMAVLAVIQGALIAIFARRRSGEVASVPDPRVVSSAPPTAGEALAAAFDGGDAAAARDGDVDDGSAAVHLQAELRETAVRLLERRPGWSREAALEAVSEGRWTDDPIAAAYLGRPGAAFVPPIERVREWAAPGSRATYRARRATDALWRLANEEAGPP